MIEPITDAADPRLAPYRHVGDHHWLARRNVFVAEGRLVVARAVAGGFAIESILVNPAAREALADTLAAARAPVYLCAGPLLNSITGFNFHRGCLALVRRPAPSAVERLPADRHLLALEGVSNPDNVGGLFRAAAAFAAGGVLLDSAAGDPLYRKAVRTSMGAVLTLPYARTDDWAEGLEAVRRRGFELWALTPSTDADSILTATHDRSSSRRVVLIVGAEGPGLGAATLSGADRRVRIPIAPGVDSLNVVVAAGIALACLAPRE